jgi:hypothetical protein
MVIIVIERNRVYFNTVCVVVYAVQYNLSEYSVGHCSTAQYNTVQYNTIQYDRCERTDTQAVRTSVSPGR